MSTDVEPMTPPYDAPTDPSPEGQVRLGDPASPPSTPIASQGEGESAGDTQEEPVVKKAPGIPFEGERAREAARKRWGDSRQRQRPTSEVLADVLAGQVQIATSGAKGITAAHRTAAAKAVIEVQAALAAALEVERGSAERIRWDELEVERHDLLDWVLAADTDDVASALAWVRERQERNAGA